MLLTDRSQYGIFLFWVLCFWAIPLLKLLYVKMRKRVFVFLGENIIYLYFVAFFFPYPTYFQRSFLRPQYIVFIFVFSEFFFPDFHIPWTLMQPSLEVHLKDAPCRREFKKRKGHRDLKLMFTFISAWFEVPMMILSLNSPSFSSILLPNLFSWCFVRAVVSRIKF